MKLTRENWCSVFCEGGCNVDTSAKQIQHETAGDLGELIIRKMSILLILSPIKNVPAEE